VQFNSLGMADSSVENLNDPQPGRTALFIRLSAEEQPMNQLQIWSKLGRLCRHPGEGRGPVPSLTDSKTWIRAFAGMTHSLMLSCPWS